MTTVPAESHTYTRQPSALTGEVTRPGKAIPTVVADDIHLASPKD
jgi:hypothetical protein